MNPRCRKVQRILASQGPGGTTPARARILNHHLAGCADCRGAYRWVRTVVDSSRRAPDRELLESLFGENAERSPRETRERLLLYARGIAEGPVRPGILPDDASPSDAGDAEDAGATSAAAGRGGVLSVRPRALAVVAAVLLGVVATAIAMSIWIGPEEDGLVPDRLAHENRPAEGSPGARNDPSEHDPDREDPEAVTPKSDPDPVASEVVDAALAALDERVAAFKQDVTVLAVEAFATRRRQIPVGAVPEPRTSRLARDLVTYEPFGADGTRAAAGLLYLDPKAEGFLLSEIRQAEGQRLQGLVYALPPELANHLDPALVDHLIGLLEDDVDAPVRYSIVRNLVEYEDPEGRLAAIYERRMLQDPAELAGAARAHYFNELEQILSSRALRRPGAFFSPLETIARGYPGRLDSTPRILRCRISALGLLQGNGFPGVSRLVLDLLADEGGAFETELLQLVHRSPELWSQLPAAAGGLDLEMNPDLARTPGGKILILLIEGGQALSRSGFDFDLNHLIAARGRLLGVPEDVEPAVQAMARALRAPDLKNRLFLRGCHFLIEAGSPAASDVLAELESRLRAPAHRTLAALALYRLDPGAFVASRGLEATRKLILSGLRSADPEEVLHTVDLALPLGPGLADLELMDALEDLLQPDLPVGIPFAALRELRRLDRRPPAGIEGLISLCDWHVRAMALGWKADLDPASVEDLQALLVSLERSSIRKLGAGLPGLREALLSRSAEWKLSRAEREELDAYLDRLRPALMTRFDPFVDPRCLRKRGGALETLRSKVEEEARLLVEEIEPLLKEGQPVIAQRKALTAALQVGILDQRVQELLEAAMDRGSLDASIVVQVQQLLESWSLDPALLQETLEDAEVEDAVRHGRSVRRLMVLIDRLVDDGQ